MRLPVEIVVPPLKALAPVRVSAPAPSLVSEPVPEITEPKLPSLTWLKVKAALLTIAPVPKLFAAPLTVPAEIIRPPP